MSFERNDVRKKGRGGKEQEKEEKKGKGRREEYQQHIYRNSFHIHFPT